MKLSLHRLNRAGSLVLCGLVILHLLLFAYPWERSPQLDFDTYAVNVPVQHGHLQFHLQVGSPAKKSDTVILSVFEFTPLPGGMSVQSTLLHRLTSSRTEAYYGLGFLLLALASTAAILVVSVRRRIRERFAARAAPRAAPRFVQLAVAVLLLLAVAAVSADLTQGIQHRAAAAAFMRGQLSQCLANSAAGERSAGLLSWEEQLEEGQRVAATVLPEPALVGVGMYPLALHDLTGPFHVVFQYVTPTGGYINVWFADTIAHAAPRSQIPGYNRRHMVQKQASIVKAFTVVKIRPRQALLLTSTEGCAFANRASSTSGPDYRKGSPQVVLHLDDTKTAELGVPAAWEVVWTDIKSLKMTFWIHSETGAILKRETQ